MGIKVSELAQELAQGLSEYSQEVADAINGYNGDVCSRRQNLPDRAGNLQSRAAGRQPVNYPENLRSGPHTDNGNVELHHL